MSLFDRASTQLLSIKQNLETARNILASVNRSNKQIFTNGLMQKPQSSKIKPPKSAAQFSSVIADCEKSVQRLCHDVGQMRLLHKIANQCSDDLTLKEVIKSALELVWQKAPLSFAAIVLGDEELGPYYYHGMMGVPEQWRYLKGECPFPLSGVLSRTLLNRLDPTEPDYLYIKDIKAEGRPLPDEFPWMVLSGSLLLLPLRLKNAIGALILGRQEINAFDDSTLCDEFYEIAVTVAKSVCGARMQHEVDKNIEQLVNVQLLTQKITRAKTFDAVIETLTQDIPNIMGAVNVRVFIDKWEGTSDRVWGELPHVLPTSQHNGFSHPFETDREKLFLQFGTVATDLQDTPEIYRLIEWSMESGEAVFYNLDAIDEHPEYPYYTDSGSAMIVPIVTSERAIGVIHMQATDHVRRFEECDMFVLRTIANSVCLVLKSMLLLEEQCNKQLRNLQKLAETVERRLVELSGHHTRVTHNATLIAEHLGLSPEECRKIHTSATLHDIGSLQLCDKKLQELFLPAQALYPNQRSLAQISSQYLSQTGVDHCVVEMIAQMSIPYSKFGYQADAPLLEPVLIAGSPSATMKHHSLNASEVDNQSAHRSDSHQIDSCQTGNQFNLPSLKWNTSTSAAPSSKKPAVEATQCQALIEIGARIITVVDAFDHALCTGNDPHTLKSQIAYLKQHSGSLFAPQVVQALLSMLKQELILLPQ